MVKERRSSMAEKPEPTPEGSGRNPRGYGGGASSATARRGNSRPGDEDLMGAVVESEKMRAAYRRGGGGKGGGGGGGVRKLGIPTVVDRLIQQAVHQVLSPVFDPHFSESSYGFRPGRSAHQAVRKAREYVASGRRWVVDLDLEKFFDRVNHDVLMSRVARKGKDKKGLRRLRR